MWAAGIRFLRRRLVLGIIFSLSLTYCIINFLKDDNNSSIPSEEFEVHRLHPIIWPTLKDYNRTNDFTTKCRNSIQGKILIVDDRGFVCQRFNLLSNGCCNVEINDTIQFSCYTCNVEHCCAKYEHCVSCCLNPEKRKILETVLKKTRGPQSALYASVADHFELCIAKCRTNSHSVRHENKYRNPMTKYCYGETKAHDSQTDIVEKSNL